MSRLRYHCIACQQERQDAPAHSWPSPSGSGTRHICPDCLDKQRAELRDSFLASDASKRMLRNIHAQKSKTTGDK